MEHKYVREEGKGDLIRDDESCRCSYDTMMRGLEANEKCVPVSKEGKETLKVSTRFIISGTR
jgi:hypothetical protein